MVSKEHLSLKKYDKYTDWEDRFFDQTYPPGYFPCDHCETYNQSVTSWCPYRMCTQWWCSICGRELGSFGPLGCPCDEDGSMMYGHHTKAEQPKAKGRVIRNPKNEYPPLVVVPFKKRKGQKK